MMAQEDKDIALTVRLSPQLVSDMEAGKAMVGIEANAEFIRYLIKSFVTGAQK